jgi:4-hydroxybenzoate polyprenyltransferase
VAEAPQSISVEELCDEGVLGRPLYVALEGGLVRTDTVWESVLVLLRQKPWLALLLPLWLLTGRAGFRQRVNARIAVDPATLPYRRDLVDVLRSSAERGRRIVLWTTGDQATARAVADHVGVFADVVVSDPKRPANGQGDGAFDFVGQSARHLTLLGAADRGYVVGSSRSDASRARALGPKIRVVSLQRSRLRAAIKVMRLHQWSKNALVVVPVLLAPHAVALSWTGIGRALVAALSLSLCASAGYVFNDLLDVAADRGHATKHRRPFASGDLPLHYGPPLLVLLFAVSFGLAFSLLPIPFVIMLALYFVITLSYSFYFKSKLLVDVIVLAWLYTHRVVAGGFATNIRISAWLMAFSMFFFFSLAFAKRHTELRQALGKTGKIHSRGYFPSDLEMVASMGPIAGYIAVLVFCLYIESDAGTLIYSRPQLLWGIAPVLLYWISRIWFLAHRGDLHDDPVKFAITDRRSWLCALLIGVVALLARFWP